MEIKYIYVSFESMQRFLTGYLIAVQVMEF